MKPIRTLAFVSLLCGSTLLAGTPAERVLRHVPSDAALVIFVPDVSLLAEGAASFGRATGIEDLARLRPAHIFGSVELLEQLDGLDERGPLVVVVGPGRPAPLFICALKDAESWKRGLKVQAKGRYYQIGAGGMAGFAAIDGPILLISEDEDQIDQATAVEAAQRKEPSDWAKRFSAAAEQLPGYQAAVCVRVPAWMPVLVPAWNAVAGSMQMAMSMSGKATPAVAKMAGWLAESAREILQQLDSLELLAKLDAEQVTIHASARFVGGGSVTKYLEGVRATDQPLLRGLPATDELLCVVAYEWDLTPEVPSIGSRMLEATIAAQEMAERMGSQAFERAFQAAKRTNDCASGSALAVLAGPPFSFLGITFTRQPEQMLEDVGAAQELQPAILGSFGFGSVMNLSAKSEKVGPTEVLVYELRFSLDDRQAQRAVEVLYGGTMHNFLAPCREGLICVGGPEDSARQMLARMLAEGGPGLADDTRVREALKRLSPWPQGLLLVDAGRVLRFGIELTRQIGEHIPELSLPATPTPLISCGLYLDRQQVRGELVVPTEAVGAVVRAVRSSEKGPGKGFEIHLEPGPDKATSCPATRPGE